MENPEGVSIRNGEPIADTDKRAPKAQAESARKTIFGVVSCARPKAATVYDNRGGGKGVTAIVCTVPLFGKLVVDVNIAAKYDPKNGDVTFKASMPQRIAWQNDALEDEFLGHAEKGAVAWSGYAGARQAALQRISEALNPKAVKTDVEAVRPRLVVKLPSMA